MIVCVAVSQCPEFLTACQAWLYWQCEWTQWTLSSGAGTDMASWPLTAPAQSAAASRACCQHSLLTMPAGINLTLSYPDTPPVHHTHTLNHWPCNSFHNPLPPSPSIPLLNYKDSQIMHSTMRGRKGLPRVSNALHAQQQQQIHLTITWICSTAAPHHC